MDTSELGVYQRAVEAAKAEIARLTTDLAGKDAALTQARNAEEAERAARMARESELGEAHAEIARLEEALSKKDGCRAT